MSCILTIDNGGTNTKAVIFDESGQQLAVSSFPTQRVEASPGFREIDLNDSWNAICQAIRLVLAQAHVNAAEIGAISCVGHGKGLYALGADGRVFTHGILSTDSRAINLANEFEARNAEIFAISHQHVMPSQSPVLLRWLKDNQPDTYAQIDVILAAKDYVRYRLTGQLNQEYGDASGNNLLNLDTQLYDPRLLDFFGIPEMQRALPPLVDATTIVGGVSADAAKTTGLIAGTPVIGGLFDIDAGALATGVLDDTAFSLIAGTWNINVYPAKQLAANESGLMNSLFPTRGYLVEASSPTSAGNLDIMLKMLLSGTNYAESVESGKIYTLLEEMLKATNAATTKAIFFPFLYGSNSDPSAEGGFLGITSKTSRSDLIRAVYEGITFAHYQHVQALQAALGHDPQVVRIAGGAANSAGWMQIFADVMNLPVETVAGSELSALGGAIAAAQAIDRYPSIEAAVAGMVHIKDRYIPNTAEHQQYTKKYALYQAALNRLNGLWTQFQEI